MTLLHVWVPKALEAVAHGMPPDFGHIALQADGLYASYWPEPGSPIGALTDALSPRSRRNPPDYPTECTDQDGFMRRRADHTLRLPELDVASAADRWSALKDEPYSLTERNCSHIVLELLRAGLPPAMAARLDEARAAEAVVVPTGDPAEALQSALRNAAAIPVLGCTPESVMALACNVLGAHPASQATG